ncbi:glutathione S-transferase family protein [Paraglaciecola arctica]|uniref:glutathione S-transferase family protein n=1 Tax=Paraglaciecola arctica TaxID=1128911 RepID=UPI001C07806D|nr:glutathione S-transferase family protein [Paraglaciecola arctica]MBU3004094.1 glutathione S-transferase family protein [Paraglaciecola arctica]
MSEQYTLYGAPMSLYTGKARAYLIFKSLPYTEVFSSLKVYKSVIVPKTGVRFVPVVKTPEDEYLQDTAQIIDTLEQRHPQRPVVPATPKQKLVSYLFETWGDEWLVIPAMHYRWNKDNFPFIYQEFGKVIAPNMPGFIRAFFGKKIGAKFKGFVPLLGITDKSIPAIEDWYENHVLPLLDKHFAEYDYLLGSKPCVGDFGLMGPLYAHLYRDPEPGSIMKERAPNLARWVERMNQPQQVEGAYLADDVIPDTLLELLTRIFKEQWPVLINTVKALQDWTEQNPHIAEIPRTIGEHAYTIGEVTENRAIGTFHQWKVQRIVDCYCQFEAQQKQSVDTFLQSVGGLESMQLDIKKRLRRVNNKLKFN